MSLVVPNGAEVQILEFFLERVLTLKLFSNDIIPGELDTTGSYTEVSGGGYAAKTLAANQWTITAGAPSNGVYSAIQEFLFTGVTDGSGVIYGYYVVDAGGLLAWAERFNEAVVPFTPIAGSLIKITPKFEAS